MCAPGDGLGRKAMLTPLYVPPRESMLVFSFGVVLSRVRSYRSRSEGYVPLSTCAAHAPRLHLGKSLGDWDRRWAWWESKV